MKEIEGIKKSGDVVLLSPASASWDQYKECVKLEEKNLKTL